MKLKPEEIQAMLHSDCKNSKGKITCVALSLDKPETIFYNKINPNNDKNHLTFMEGIEVIEYVRSTKVVSAIAGLINHIIVPIPQVDHVMDGVSQSFMKTIEHLGKLSNEIQEAKDPNSKDGSDVSACEAKKIHSKCSDLIACVVGIQQMMNELIEQAKE